MHKILVVARGGIGNVLMFTPTLKVLKDTFPESDIYMMVLSNGAHEILLNNPDITEIITYDRGIKSFRGLVEFIMVLRRMRFDVAIVMYPGGLRSALWAFISGAKTRIGFDMPLLRGLGGLLYTHLLKPNDELHNVEQNLNIICSLGATSHANSTLAVFIPDNLQRIAKQYLAAQGYKSEHRIIGFHPGSNASQKWKRWPARYYSTLINMLASDQNTSMLVFGDRNENDLISNILSGVNESVKIIKIVDTDLMVSAALIGLCHAFVGNDSGLIHVAAAQCVPTFCIVGPTDIKKTRPYGPKSYIIRSEFECSCRYNFNTINFKCSQTPAYKCLNELQPEEVYRQICLNLSPFVGISRTMYGGT